MIRCVGREMSGTAKKTKQNKTKTKQNKTKQNNKTTCGKGQAIDVQMAGEKFKTPTFESRSIM
jgi:hypothetical protein